MFLLEVDNGAYLFLLGEKTRKRVELRARIELTDEESKALNRSKNFHAICVVITLSVTIALVAVDKSVRHSIVIIFLLHRTTRRNDIHSATRLLTDNHHPAPRSLI